MKADASVSMIVLAAAVLAAGFLFFRLGELTDRAELNGVADRRSALQTERFRPGEPGSGELQGIRTSPARADDADTAPRP